MEICTEMLFKLHRSNFCRAYYIFSGSSANITVERDCVTSFLSECSAQFGTEQSTLLHHYVETLDDVFTTICDQGKLFIYRQIGF